MIANVAKLKNVPGQSAQLALEYQPRETDCDGSSLVFLRPVNFIGSVRNTGATILVQGQVATTVELACSRCGETVPFPVEAVFEENYAHHPQPVSADGEECHVFQGDEIQIFPQVAQAILLELPMKVLCRQSCQGLCPECGANLNVSKCRCAGSTVDPRLMALQKLLETSSTEGGVINGGTKKEDIESE